MWIHVNPCDSMSLQSKALDWSHMKLHGSRNPVCPWVWWLYFRSNKCCRCSMLQRVAACCSVLQSSFSLNFPAQWRGSSFWRSRWCCSVLRCCSVLQCGVAVFCYVLQCVAACCNFHVIWRVMWFWRRVLRSAVFLDTHHKEEILVKPEWYKVLQCVAMPCSVLQSSCDLCGAPSIFGLHTTQTRF